MFFQCVSMLISTHMTHLVDPKTMWLCRCLFRKRDRFIIYCIYIYIMTLVFTLYWYIIYLSNTYIYIGILSIYLSVCLSIYYLSIYLYIYILSIYISIYLYWYTIYITVFCYSWIRLSWHVVLAVSIEMFFSFFGLWSLECLITCPPID